MDDKLKNKYKQLESLNNHHKYRQIDKLKGQSLRRKQFQKQFQKQLRGN